MKNISIFKGKPKWIEAVFTDGYICTIIWTGYKYRLEGKTEEFETLSQLSDRYKGTIRSMRVIKGSKYAFKQCS